MRIIVKVRPRSRQAKVEKIDDGQYWVWVRAVPKKGRANAEMLELVADYFSVDIVPFAKIESSTNSLEKSNIEAVRGQTRID